MNGHGPVTARAYMWTACPDRHPGADRAPLFQEIASAVVLEALILIFLAFAASVGVQERFLHDNRE